MALIKQTGILGNHPILIATTAASGGVLLGIYVAMQIFAAPVPNSAKVPAAAPVAESKPPVKPIETTAAAPAKEETVADRCEGQTWPNLSRECTEQMQKNRPARVVTTDRVEKPVPETPAAPRTESVASLPAPVAPAPTVPAPSASPPSAIAPAAAVPSASASTSVSTSAGAMQNTFAPNTAAPVAPAAKPAPSQPAVAAVQPATPSPAAEPAPKAVAVAAPSNPQDAIVPNEPPTTSKAAEKRKAKEAKRSKKKERENLDDDGTAFAAVDRDRDSRRDARDSRDRDLRDSDDERTDRAADRAERRSLRAEGRSDRSRRERGASSDGDDENAFSNRQGGRRVVVIERDSDAGERRGGGLFGRGGLFGGLFGD